MAIFFVVLVRQVTISKLKLLSRSFLETDLGYEPKIPLEIPLIKTTFALYGQILFKNV
jgi:hypothetical protein